MAASDSASKLASLHDIPAPNSGVFASVESGELTAAEDDFAACWAWFRKRLLREPLGPEMFDVARRLYHAGLYEAAAVILLLFRGAHPDIRVRGGSGGCTSVGSPIMENREARRSTTGAGASDQGHAGGIS